MNDEFITLFFKNQNVKDIVITNKNNLYQISAGGHTVTHADFLRGMDEIYNLIRYDPLQVTVANYMNFIVNGRIDSRTFNPFYVLDSTCLPPSMDELKRLNIEFVKNPTFYAHGKQYDCVSRLYKNGDKIDYSVYKWLYTMCYDSEGDCIIRGVLKVNV